VNAAIRPDVHPSPPCAARGSALGDQSGQHPARFRARRSRRSDGSRAERRALARRAARDPDRAHALRIAGRDRRSRRRRCLGRRSDRLGTCAEWLDRVHAALCADRSDLSGSRRVAPERNLGRRRARHPRRGAGENRLRSLAREKPGAGNPRARRWDRSGRKPARTPRDRRARRAPVLARRRQRQLFPAASCCPAGSPRSRKRSAIARSIRKSRIFSALSSKRPKRPASSLA
jgi:hypothetical protein